MNTKNKIVQTLTYINSELRQIMPQSYIIGASAMILSDINIGDTQDIDILTTDTNTDKLKILLNRHIETDPDTKDDNLFKSNFAQFHLPLMDVEVMGDLKIRKDNIWQPVTIHEYREITIGNLKIKVPTVKDQI